MRTVQTFILRLLIDPAEPEALRGALVIMPEGESRSFANGQTLLALLGQTARQAGAILGNEADNPQDAS